MIGGVRECEIFVTADGSEFGLFCHSSEKRANQLILSNGGQDYDNFGDYALIECVGGNFMAKKGGKYSLISSQQMANYMFVMYFALVESCNNKKINVNNDLC